MTWDIQTPAPREWDRPARTTPAFIWDRQDSAAVQTRWDAGATSWDEQNAQQTLWDLDILTSEIWT